jgi:glycosyltransferase involved in cell wall biosynthesis
VDSLRIAIATIGRFHVLDLARELAALGHQVAFWSVLPRRRLARYGLPRESHRRVMAPLLPLLAAQRFGGSRTSGWATPRLLAAADRVIARRLEPCDVFIGMSGLCIESAQAARSKFGAKVFIERGSRHILSQKSILDDLRLRGLSADVVPDYAVSRELASYAAADRVVIPAIHVEESFVAHGYPAEKLFRNPYGVDLSMFAATPAPPSHPPTLIYVGAWSYRKGVDVLEAAWRRLEGVRLLHVGAVADAPLPTGPGFIHVEPVPQSRLRDYYAQAHLFVLASREEGLALVQPQALACGLPLVCTSRTGGADLKYLLDDPARVTVVPPDDAEALAAAIREVFPRALAQRGQRHLPANARDQLAWSAYGRRYAGELGRVVAKNE